MGSSVGALSHKRKYHFLAIHGMSLGEHPRLLWEQHGFTTPIQWPARVF